MTAELLEKTALVIVESKQAAQNASQENVPYFQVADGRRALSLLIAKAYGNPEDKLKFWGSRELMGKPL